MPEDSSTQQYWPGQRFNLPASGPRSIGSLGRRIAAIAIDWAIASAIGYAFFGGDAMAILAAFAVLQYVLLVLVSGSIGHLVLGLRVVPLKPRWIGVWRPLVRTVLLCIVIPAVVWDRDQRGLHDQIAGTVLVRR